MLTWDQALFFFLLPCFLGRLQSMIAGYASVSSARTGAKIHQIANQKRDFIEKYVNIIYALGSAHVNFAVLFAGFYSTSWFVSLTWVAILTRWSESTHNTCGTEINEINSRILAGSSPLVSRSRQLSPGAYKTNQLRDWQATRRTSY